MSCGGESPIPVNEDGATIYLDRIRGGSGAYITQASISSIKRVVVDVDLKTLVKDNTLTVSAVVYDTLQTDADRWPYSPGYNFLDTLPADSFPTPEHRYVLQYEFTPTSGELFMTTPLTVQPRRRARSYAT